MPFVDQAKRVSLRVYKELSLLIIERHCGFFLLHFQLFDYYFWPQHSFGVKKLTIFWKLRHCGFNPISSFVLDAMHNLFIGCVAKLASFWFSVAYRDFPFSCYVHIREIDIAIQETYMQVPHEFSRRPRPISVMSHYKGFFYFLLCYSFCSLYGKSMVQEKFYYALLPIAVC